MAHELNPQRRAVPFGPRDASPTPPAPGSLPGMDPNVEAERRRTLRRYQALATGLLLLAAAIFIACTWAQHAQEHSWAWLGYVRAAAEAGMVGGLADWFAVTALFRHPMGLKIPHTALVKNKKDQLGDALSSFVGENFLNAEVITAKVAQAEIPERLGTWLTQPGNATKVSREIGHLIGRVTRAIDPADAEAVINRAVIERLAEPTWGPPVGRALDELISEGRTEPIIDSVAKWLHRKALGAEGFIVSMIDERKPVWAPKFVNDLVGDKIYREIIGWTQSVAENPNHEARQAMRRFITKLAYDLQHEPGTIAKVEELKADILGSTPVQGAARTIWASASTSLIDAAEDPHSLLRTKVEELAVTWGNNILHDPSLRASLDRRIKGAVQFFADNYAGEVTSIISETVARWDAEEASEKIELMVGKDLQYIRLNGTIVGSLAGLAIYTVSQLLFGG